MPPSVKLAAAFALVLVMSSCARPSIEEMGRNAIRQEAAKGKDWFAVALSEIEGTWACDCRGEGRE
jgi:hypothetical protein